MNRIARIAVACCVTGFASIAFAQDWPQWRGPARDGKPAGFEAPATWPKQLATKWKVKVGQGDAGPALVGSNLYVFARDGADEVTLCLEAATGKEIWRDKYAAAPATGPAGRHPGPRSTPAVAEGKVVTLGVGGVLSCLNAADGKLVWRNDKYKSVPQFFTSMSPIIADGLAIAHLGGQGNAALAAFDLATGEPKWTWTGDAPAYASPVLLTADGVKQVVSLTDKLIVGISAADGKLLWQAPFAPQRRAYNAATPIVDGQTVIYTGAARGTKAVKIAKQGDAFAATELWSNPDLAPQYNSPVLEKGLLFGVSDRGNLFCLDAKSGKTAWTDSTKLSAFCSTVDAGPAILALPESGDMVVFKADGSAFSELARYKVADSAVYAHPVVSGKRIFVKDAESVTLWSVD